MGRLSISLPVYSTGIAKLRDMVVWAEAAGFEAAFPYEIVRNPFLTLAAAAPATDRIKLGTAIAVAFSRSPFVTAAAAADLDELSGGRFILGLGPGEGQFLRGLHNTDLADAVPRMREYVTVVRKTWESLDSGIPARYQGEHYRLDLEGLTRSMTRPQIPIYLAAMGSQRMMRLAGEIGDGLLAFFYSLPYLKNIGIPQLAAGARAAGRDPSTVDLCSYVIVCVSRDRAEAQRWARIQVGFYSFLGSSDPMIRYLGLEKEQALVRQAMADEGPAALEKVTDDKLVEAFSVTGTPDECRRQLAEYQEVLPLPLLHVPYFEPLTAEESEAAFRNILDTFGT